MRNRRPPDVPKTGSCEIGRPGAIPAEADEASGPAERAPGFLVLSLVRLLPPSPSEPGPFLGWDGDGLKDFFDEFCMTDPIGLYFW